MYSALIYYLCCSHNYFAEILFGQQFLAGTESQSQGGSTHIPAAFRNFSMSQKEKTLEELEKDRWISLKDGKIGLGVRSFLDLRSWFRNNEVPSCEVCNEAAVKVYSSLKFLLFNSMIAIPCALPFKLDASICYFS